MRTYYTVHIEGIKAVNLADKIIGNRCYLHLGNLGQLEIVDDDLVDLSYIGSFSDLLKSLKWLKQNGFNGCKTFVSLDKQFGCFAETLKYVEYAI